MSVSKVPLLPNGFIPFVWGIPSTPNVVTINGKSYDLTGALGLSTETSKFDYSTLL